MLVVRLGLCILVYDSWLILSFGLLIGFAYGLDVLYGAICVFYWGLVFGGLVGLVFGGFW